MKALAIGGLLAGLFGCQQESILVQGEATASFDPDYVLVTTELTSFGQTTEEAAAVSSKRVAEILEGLTKAGFDKNGVTVNGFSIARHCEDEEAASGRRTKKCDGFDAYTALNVKLKELAKTGVLLGTLAALRIDSIERPTFGVEDSQTRINDLRAAALENARSVAGAYARKSGRTVGSVLHLEDVASKVNSYWSRFGSGLRASGTEIMTMIMAPRSEQNSTIVPITIEKVTFEEQVYAEFELR